MALMSAAGGPSTSGGSTNVSGSAVRIGPGNSSVTTSSASVGTVTGGTTPYSYLWGYVSGDVFTVNSSTSSSTTFTASITVGVGGSVTKTGVYQCRITDAAGAIGYGPQCAVSATLTESS